MYTMAEEYYISCLVNKKKASGKKLASLGQIDYKKIYDDIHGIASPKICIECKVNHVAFIDFSQGYRKYCSKPCFTKHMSQANILENKHRNLARSIKLKMEQKDKLLLAAQLYKESYDSIKTVAQKVNLSPGALRQYLVSNDLIRKRSQILVRNQNLEIQFCSINEKLKDSGWVKSKIEAGFTAKMFAHELGCSPNYVASFLREIGSPLLGNGFRSSYELQLASILDSIGVNYEQNTRSIIHPNELDFWVPSHNLAIEVNGLYWHSSNFKPKNYHWDKTQKCNNIGIRLLHIYDSELNEKFDIVKSIVLNALGRSKQIYAKTTRIQVLTTSEYKLFLDINHLQGYIPTSIKLGLFRDEELVAVLGLSKSRYDKTHQYELIRYCNKLNHTVVGGASKLFTHFVKTYAPDSVLSYAQARLFTGKMYENLGMTCIRKSPPNYSWVNAKNDILTRYQTQKHQISQGRTDIRTEKEIMTGLGYYQVYDCGQLVYSISFDK
jgi:G:T-mismatch repair DNA endonuclease (very short patch repair protein)